ncbi:MAG: hypothetical protein HC882_04975 [Acidobacteria bacterium]|nr:hypothetical protein [Acidobacteriota bacterium]
MIKVGENAASIEVLAIDAWNGPDGWWWNDSRTIGHPESMPDARDVRAFLRWLRAEGYLGAGSAGRVRVDVAGSDPEVYEIQDRHTGEPLVAVRVEW